MKPVAPNGTRALRPLVILTALLLSAPGAFAGNPPEVTIEIQNLKFSPAVLTLPVGSTVHWRNHDETPHDVTSGTSIIGRAARGLKKTKFPDGHFSSGLFPKDASFSFTFDQKGEYPFYCNIHPFMIGKIIIE